MNAKTEIATNQKTSLITTMANKYGVDENKMMTTMKATCFKQSNNAGISNEQMMALLVVANEYGLNPFTREIYAFPQNGGIVPIVGIDGWLNIINSHPKFNGMQFVDEFDDNNKIVSVTCKIYRKDRDHATEVTEYLAECQKNTEPWKKWAARMLRHKATIQAARYAFGFSGIYDPDEADRIKEVSGSHEIVEKKEEVILPSYTDDQFKLDLDDWKVMVIGGKKTPDEIISIVSMKYTLTETQQNEIHFLGEIDATE